MGAGFSTPGLGAMPQQGQQQQGQQQQGQQQQGDVPAFNLPPPPPGMGGMPPQNFNSGQIGRQGPVPQMSDDDYLRMMYQTQLGRQGDQGGMDYWRQQMAGGMGRDQVMNMMRGTPEGQQYQQHLAPMMDDFGRGRPEMPPGNPDDFINRVYQSQLGRAPEQGGMDYWRQQMAGGMDPRQMQEMVMRSQEAQSRGPQMDPQIMDALRLAQQRQQPTPTYDPSVRQQRPNMDQIQSLLGMLGVL